MGAAFSYGSVTSQPARDFLDERRDAQAERTTKGDRTALQDWEAWLDGDVLDASTMDFVRFIRFLRDREGYAASTIETKVSTVSKFYKWLTRWDYLEENPFDPEKVDLSSRIEKTQEYKWLPQEDCLTVLNQSRHKLRDWIALSLMYMVGLRRKEVVNLYTDEVDTGARVLSIRREATKSKSGVREVPMPGKVARMIEHYLDYDRPLLATDRSPKNLMLSTTGNSLHPNWATRRPGKYAEKAGIQEVIGHTAGDEPKPIYKIQAHRFRHTYGTVLLNDGVRLETVSKLMGHSSVKVTEDIYAELLDTTAQEEYRASETAFFKA